MELEFPAVPESVGKARHAVVDFAAQCSAGTEDIAIAVSEAVSNAVLHAYRAVSKPGLISVVAEREGDVLLLEVSDFGDGLAPHPESPGAGFGLGLIGSVSTFLELRTGRGAGLSLSMRFPCV